MVQKLLFSILGVRTGEKGNITEIHRSYLNWSTAFEGCKNGTGGYLRKINQFDSDISKSNECDNYELQIKT